MKTISRYIMTLALLITAVSGAWATDEVLLTTVTATSQTTYSQSPDGIVTVALSGIDNYIEGFGWVRTAAGTATVTVEANEGYTITRCVFKQNADNYPNRVIEDDLAPFVMTINGGGMFSIPSSFVEASDGQRKVTDMDGLTVIEVYGAAAPAEPAIEVTTNAAEEGATFTEASFEMPTSDVDVDYELVRDMQDEANPVAFSGLPSSGNIVVKKGSDGKYQPAEALTIQLIDPLAAAEVQNIIAADGLTVKVLVGNGGTPIEYDQVNPITLEAFLADMKPGYYWIKAEPTDENSHYDGTVYSSEFTVVEKYDLTVKPANEYSAGKLDKVIVGSGEEATEITPDATTGEAAREGIDPNTEVKITAKKGYIIEKVEVKKGAAAAKTIIIGDVELTYADGDTWETIVSKNSDKIKTLSGRYIVQVAQPAPDTYTYIHVWYTAVKPSDIIDPSKNYQWSTLEVAY